MSVRLKVRTGRLAAIAVAAAAFVIALALTTMAFAADETQQKLSSADIFQQLTSSPVDEAACTTLCHGNIAATKNYSAEIIFSHGNHILMQCSDCHPRFPHRQSGTERPTMKGCFNCHGVRHGPRGILAKGNCEACHNTPRWQKSCPYSKTVDWVGAGHVKQGTTDVNNDCMLCHTEKDCTTCHDRTGITWQPANDWVYDPGEKDGPKSGCLACHGNATLLKTSGAGTQSFQVTGVQDSAHRDITCQQCHPDYRYDDKPAATKVWTVNAGLQCGVCHQNAEKEKDRAPVALYEKSIHAEQIRKGNYESATCSSCHGGHFITRLDTAEASATMHASAYRVCARCKQHGVAYETYDDYYHGKAYKQGAPDAPACWQCHKSHDILPKSDPKSSVYPANVGTTCGQPGCHKGSTEKFGADAAQLIHQKVQEQENNPLVKLIGRLQGMVGL